MAVTPLILDVDTGVDDAMALLYAAASPEVELIGTTASWVTSRWSRPPRTRSRCWS